MCEALTLGGRAGLWCWRARGFVVLAGVHVGCALWEARFVWGRPISLFSAERSLALGVA